MEGVKTSTFCRTVRIRGSHNRSVSGKSFVVSRIPDLSANSRCILAALFNVIFQFSEVSVSFPWYKSFDLFSPSVNFVHKFASLRTFWPIRMASLIEGCSHGTSHSYIDPQDLRHAKNIHFSSILYFKIFFWDCKG